ncbi:MMPL family transporter [Faunimonas pinastri]|uniref:MMPL family transporter n=1 Tax=Faunimonas pinastri TaxID=1855383 RepID=UPI001EEC2944|nr:MMPL family transporter [Faunimonas pinastri]
MRRPWIVIALSAVIVLLLLYVTVTRFAINTDTTRLISADLPWRQNEIAFNKAFPQNSDLIAVVIDGDTPEHTDDAADRLVAALSKHSDVFRSVRRPDAGPFLARNGLLLLPTDEARARVEQMLRSQPLLAPLAADPSLRGLMTAIQGSLQMMAQAGAAGSPASQANPQAQPQPQGSAQVAPANSQASSQADPQADPRAAQAAGLQQFGPALERISVVLDRVLSGERARLSWQGLLSGQPSEPADLRKIVLAQPVLDFNALQPGAAATDLVRQTIADLGITGENDLRARLTGDVPLADEEFATVAENAGLNVSLTVLAIAVILFLALRSGRVIFAVLVTLFAGLIATSGVGLLMVGELNLISVAFAVLFIGLGVDFGIQIAVRYRAERFAGNELRPAIVKAGRIVGWSLTLAAVSLLAGFLSFLPTEFKGVSELGLIAGVGMIIAYLASLTLLPALLVVLRPPVETVSVDTQALVHVDRWIERHRWLVIAVTALVVIGGIPFLMKLRFDANPMDLRSKKVESVSTFLDLSRDPDTSPNTTDVLRPNLADADGLAGKLAALPEVARTLTLSTFIPDDQAEKLAIIREAAARLGPVLTPGQTAPAPTDAELVQSLSATVAALRQASQGGGSAVPASFGHFADDLDSLARADAAKRSAAQAAIVSGLPTVLSQLRTSLTAQPITRESLPADFAAEWIAGDGRARVQVFPKGNSNDAAVLDRFTAAVRAVAPDATGAPIAIAESGRTIVRAFIEAGIFALVAIFIILAVALRRPVDVILALAPLVLAGIMSLEFAYLIGLPLNFANIIALPLMFGVGVAFHIYYVIAWRAGVADMLASSLTRAIFFSALTTGTAFGSLCFSSHPGTASMGELLAVSLFFTLLAAFIIVPAFLGPTPEFTDKPKAGLH